MVAILVIAYSLFVMVLCIVIFGKKGKEEDNNLKRMKSIGKEVVTAEYKNVETSFYDRNIKPIVTKLASLDEKVINRVRVPEKAGNRKTCSPTSQGRYAYVNRQF